MTPTLLLFVAAVQVSVPPESAEVRLRNIRQLTFDGLNAEAYFSKSGRQLILQRQDSAHACDQQYVMNTDGSGLRLVSSGLGRTTCGYFYADDQRIFYASSEHVDSACPPRPDRSQGYVWAVSDFDFYTAKPDGSDKRRLTTHPEYDAEGTLSPDGKTIVFTSLRDGDLDIYTMNVDGSNVRRLTHTLGYDGGPFYSPDGKLIVYRTFHPQTAADSAEYLALLAKRLVRPTRMEIWVMNADGSGQRQLTRLGGANFAPYFHPDGKRIIFASNYRSPRSPNFNLYLINPDGTGLEQVTTALWFNSFPMFSPDGRQLVWASGRHGRLPDDINIFIADWVERP